jgi:hypothetical protein
MSEFDAAQITQREWDDMKNTVQQIHVVVIALKTVCENRPETCALRFRKRPNGDILVESVADADVKAKIKIIWGLIGALGASTIILLTRFGEKLIERIFG